MYPYDNYFGNQFNTQATNAYNQSNLSMLNTNVIKVTSLDEAIMRTNLRNCEMVYFDQNGKIFYIIRVDGVGNKSWDILSYAPANANNTVPATKDDVLALTARVEALEKKSVGEPNV